jgi:hypothetical protein
MANVAVVERQMTVIPPNADADAAEIGRLYALARTSLVDSMRYAIDCGHKLDAKKKSVKHGEWMPWLADNEDILGFSTDRTAQRLIRLAANPTLASDLREATAASVSRKLWGHKDSELVQQSLSNEHYTPKQYLDAAREVFGGSIDLDPASCAEANQVVHATEFFTAEDDGLTKPWHGNVWLNPPYGRHVGDFVAKFIEECKADHTKAGIVLVNAHCTDTDWFQPLWNGVLCFTNHRVNFYGDDVRSGSTHGSVFVYFGPDGERFAQAFKQFGVVVEISRLSEFEQLDAVAKDAADDAESRVADVYRDAMRSVRSAIEAALSAYNGCDDAAEQRARVFAGLYALLENLDRPVHKSVTTA